MTYTMNNGDEYRISDRVTIQTGDGTKDVPILDIKPLTDYKWQALALKSRRENRELYAQYEDVDEAIKELEQWVKEHGEK